MTPERLGFFARLWLAFILPWIVLFNPEAAHRVERALRRGSGEGGERERQLGDSERQRLAGSTIEVAPQPPAAAAPRAARSDGAAALQVLAILQREGRFIDFLEEDVSSFSDAEIGAAARVVHEGCKRGLNEYVLLEPVRTESEGADVVLERGFDATRTRVTGNVVGEPPFRGRLAHHGWQVKELHLPKLAAAHDPKVLAPAEVEL